MGIGVGAGGIQLLHCKVVKFHHPYPQSGGGESVGANVSSPSTKSASGPFRQEMTSTLESGMSDGSKPAEATSLRQSNLAGESITPGFSSLYNFQPEIHQVLLST